MIKQLPAEARKEYLVRVTIHLLRNTLTQEQNNYDIRKTS